MRSSTSSVNRFAAALAACFSITCGHVAAQIVLAASIIILPSPTPSLSDQVVARITYEMVDYYTFVPHVTSLPGGVLEVTLTATSASQGFPRVETFDVNLGVLPQGTYTVRFRPGLAVLALRSLRRVRTPPTRGAQS